MKDIWKIILTHVGSFIVGTVLYVFLFHTSVFANINIFFYRGVVLLFVICLIMFIVLLVFKKKTNSHFFTFRDIVLSIIILFSFNIIFFTYVPVTIDRSVSIFMLGYVSKFDKPLTTLEVTKQFTKEYLDKQGGIQRRLDEQIVSRNVFKVGGKYQISKQGQLLVDFYSFVADLFGLNKKNLSR